MPACQTNTDLARLATSGIRRFTALANQTPGCVKLTLGEPEFDTPEPVREAVTESLSRGLTHYPPNNGRPELLAALSAYMRVHGLSYDEDELIVTCGATEALSASLLALLDPGDEVIVPVPAFGLNETIVRAAHGTYVPFDTSEHGFQICEEELESVITSQTRAIIITSPNNPTGCIYTPETLDAVANCAARHGFCVICDDVYNRLVYDAGYERFAVRHPELREQTIVVDSFSKPWAMTGWRLGWLAAAPSLKSQVEKMHQYLVSSVPAFLQDAAVVALGLGIDEMVATYKSRRDLVCSRLDAMGLSFNSPGGAFYAFPRIESFGMSSEEFCERAIREAGVALVPGSCFGVEGFTRLSYCVSDNDLETGLERLGEFTSSLRGVSF